MLAILSGFLSQYSGQLMIGVLMTAIVLFTEALLMDQNVQLYFRVVGIELIVVLFIGWAFYMLQGDRETGKP